MDTKKRNIIIAGVLLLLVTLGGGALLYINMRVNQEQAPSAPESQPSAASCTLEFTIPTPTPEPTPVMCNASCTLDTDCPTSMTCSNGFCRNPQCVVSETCLCATPTPTPTASPTSTPTTTPIPQCLSECVTSQDCPSSMTCSAGRCKNPSCVESNSCVCATSTPTPSPTSTPGPNQGGFYIRKYFDRNGNGVQDSGEHGLSWKFEYDVDSDGNYKGYETQESKSGEGGVVTFNEATKIRIREIAADGWTATSPTNVEITIRSGENQLLVFGNDRPEGTPLPNPVCGSNCTADSQCPSSMTCYLGICRNPSCADSSSCTCPIAQSVPVPEPPEQLPVAGSSAPTALLAGIGFLMVLIGIAALFAL